MSFDWTDERVQLVRDGAAGGKSAGDVAAELGISRNAVIGKAGRIGVQFNSYHHQNRYRDIARPKRERPKVEKLVKAKPARARFWEFITDLPPDTSDHAVSLLDARDGQCRYPVQSQGALEGGTHASAGSIPARPGQFMFCGAPVVDDKHSWCGRHCAIVYTRPREFLEAAE